MRSSELAELAGVTVRALRHYHQIGILDEPPRSSNGYREYDVGHLVRVLRIARLADLGFALQDLPLDEESDHDARLADLDDELADRIEHLEGQRRIVAALRAAGASPDLPPELAAHTALVAAIGLPASLARLEREQLMLIERIGGEPASRVMAALYERSGEPDVLPLLTDIYARFDRLDDRTPAVERERLVEDCVRALGRVVDDLDLDLTQIDLSDAGTLFDEHGQTHLSPAQNSLLEEVGTRLAERPA